MRASLLGIFLCMNVWAAGPCETEKQVFENSNNLIRDHEAEQIGLRSQITTEAERRAGALRENLQQSEARLSAANRNVLQETRLLDLLQEQSPLLNRLSSNAESQIAAGRDTAVCLNERSVPFSQCLESLNDADWMAFARLVRALEGSRAWSEQMTDLREEAAGGRPVLASAVDKAVQMQEILSASLGNPQLSELKQQAAEAQSKIDQSLQRQRADEERSAILKKRIESLKQALPKQKTGLHQCMRREQFGN